MKTAREFQYPWTTNAATYTSPSRGLDYFSPEELTLETALYKVRAFTVIATKQRFGQQTAAASAETAHKEPRAA